MSAKNKEHEELVTQILLQFGADPRLRIWKQPTGGTFAMSGQFIKYGVVGGGDLSGILRLNGKRLEIEVKTGNATQGKDQIAFQAMIEFNHGHYLVCRSLTDFSEWLDRISPK